MQYKLRQARLRAKDFLILSDNDIIYNPNDIDELVRKIENFICNDYDNYELISNSIDKEKTSLEFSAKKLKNYTNEILGES